MASTPKFSQSVVFCRPASLSAIFALFAAIHAWSASLPPEVPLPKLKFPDVPPLSVLSALSGVLMRACWSLTPWRCASVSRLMPPMAARLRRSFSF